MQEIQVNNFKFSPYHNIAWNLLTFPEKIFLSEKTSEKFKQFQKEKEFYIGLQRGILGHQYNKRLKSFAPCYSQSLLLADFEENHSQLLSF